VARHPPEGVFQVVPGGTESGKLLVEHPDVAAVSFTGSIVGGRTVARQVVSRGAKIQCETGGQNPTVILADADLDRAAETITYAAMGYAGQKRTATTQVIAEAIVYEELRGPSATARPPRSPPSRSSWRPRRRATSLATFSTSTAASAPPE
jgi:acyl-CoA reductase-like NAD-dependent aldehyde dehydrogenase